MVRTQIQLTEEQSEALKRLASARHLPIAELIRQAVDNLVRTNISVDSEERRKRAIALAGRFHSGRHDISKEHDKYIAEAVGK